MATVLRPVDLSNRDHAGTVPSVSLGVATRRPRERPEETVKQADAAMDVDKRACYTEAGPNRRGAKPA